MSLYAAGDPQYKSFYTQSITSDGTTTSFLLTYNPGSSSAILVVQDGVLQRPGLDYNVQAGYLVFLTAPAAPEIGITSNIFVTFLGVMVSIPTPAANSVGSSQLQSNSVGASQLQSNSVNSSNIIDGSIVYADLNTTLTSTSAQAQAFISTNTFISPATLAAAFQGSNQTLAASGYQKLPGGLIIQWGVSGTINTGSSVPVTFPIAFPNNVFKIIPSLQGANIATAVESAVQVESTTPAPSLSGCTFNKGSNGGGVTHAVIVNYIVIGN